MDACRPSTTPSVRREYHVRPTPEIRLALDSLAQRYNLHTPDGNPRDAEIARVLLVCALTSDLPAHEQAVRALYVNGLMLVSQGLRLGMVDVRIDIADVMTNVLEMEAPLSLPAQNSSTSTRGRIHMRIDEWTHGVLQDIIQCWEDVPKDSPLYETIRHLGSPPQDTALVNALIQLAAANPNLYRKAFDLYAIGVAQVREGLVVGMTTVRDTLRDAMIGTGAL